jgi:hypothetical protein
METNAYYGHVLVRGINGADWMCQRCGFFRAIVETDEIFVEDFTTDYRGPGYVVTLTGDDFTASVTVSEGWRQAGYGTYTMTRLGLVPRHTGRDWRDLLFAEAIDLIRGMVKS